MKDSIDKLPNLVVSDGSGNVYDIPDLKMTGMSGLVRRVPEPKNLIVMPPGSDLFELPGRFPVGYDPSEDRMVVLREYNGRPVTAVAAFMAPAYVQTLRASYESAVSRPVLPLYAYTAAGWLDGSFHAAGFRIDPDPRQDPPGFDEGAVSRGAAELLNRYPDNRLVSHLVGNCVRKYRCPAARNLALGRYEAPLPVSPTCNARCVGCLSQRRDGGAPCSQDRIGFVPTSEEIAEIAVAHIDTADKAVVSFGQGCEGEPLMQADVIERSILLIRSETGAGTINLNTNGSRPDRVAALFDAGLDSIRVSVNSFQPECYERYFRPVGYSFRDVMESIRTAELMKKWVSINYFVFPGFTDSPAEMEAFFDAASRVRIGYIQARNLNIDPGIYIEALGAPAFARDGCGIGEWRNRICDRIPGIGFGYFNPAKEDWPAITAGAGRRYPGC